MCYELRSLIDSNACQKGDRGGGGRKSMSKRQHLTAFFQALWAKGRTSGPTTASSTNSHHIIYTFIMRQHHARKAHTSFHPRRCPLRSGFLEEWTEAQRERSCVTATQHLGPLHPLNLGSLEWPSFNKLGLLRTSKHRQGRVGHQAGMFWTLARASLPRCMTVTAINWTPPLSQVGYMHPLEPEDHMR